jgi:DNA-binding GntR family transcriptional regulator
MVVRALRSSILEGKLRPGTRLPYRDLAKRFNVSVTPVRTALRELAKEGMVEVRPHLGVQVAPLSSEELEELYATRAGLEPWLARIGAPSLSDDDLALMEAKLATVRRAVAARDRESYLQAAWECRSICYTAAQRPRLLAVVSTLYVRSTRYNFFTVSEDERLDQSLSFTARFGTACRSRDGFAAQAVLREALDWSLSTTLTAYKQRFDRATA